MVKKVNQASLNITKNESKKQLNNLIKVLRPKVYIIDSSNFKSLVQELTGNGSSIVTSPPALSIQVQQQVRDHHLENYVNVPVINVEEDHGEPQSSMEAVSSFDTSLDSFDDDLFNNEYFPEGLFTELAHDYHQIHNLYDEKSTLDAGYSIDQWVDWIACQDVESWLLDIDHLYPNFDGFTHSTQDVNVYDYELSGLVSGNCSLF